MKVVFNQSPARQAQGRRRRIYFVRTGLLHQGRGIDPLLTRVAVLKYSTPVGWVICDGLRAQINHTDVNGAFLFPFRSEMDSGLSMKQVALLKGYGLPEVSMGFHLAVTSLKYGRFLPSSLYHPSIIGVLNPT